MLYYPQHWFACREEKVPKRDRMKVLARSRLPTLLQATGGGRCYIRCVLWYSTMEMRQSLNYAECNGLFVPAPSRIRYGKGLPKRGLVVTSRCLGRIHLAVDSVTLEAVAHELTHALVRRLQAESPTARTVLAQRGGKRWHGGRADEEVAYDMGRWVSALHAWIASHTVTMPRGRGRKSR